MLKILYAAVIGLFGAGIVHIAILLALPEFSERDAWSRLAMASDVRVVTRLDQKIDDSPIVPGGDPLFIAAACRFDLDEGAVQIRAEGSVPFWSVSVYNRAGQNVYSFNDHTAEGGKLDFVVLTPDQMIEARKDLPEAFQKSIFVETPIGEGMLVVRALVPDQSWKKLVTDYLAEMRCTLQ